jgi:hypothetical protein
MQVLDGRPPRHRTRGGQEIDVATSWHRLEEVARDNAASIRDARGREVRERLSAGRIRAGIIRLAYSGLDSVNLRRQVTARLRSVVAMDAYGFATVDPATMLFTGAVRENIPEAVIPRLAKNEFGEDDFNKFVDLAVHRHRVGRLVII